MSYPRRRLLSIVVAAALLFLSAPFFDTPSAVAARQSTPQLSMTVLAVSPSTPVPDFRTRSLRITLSLTNITSTPIRHVQIRAERGQPITSQSQLNASLASAANPGSGLDIDAASPIELTLRANQSRQVTFRTITSEADGTGGLCLCYDAIYPINLFATTTTDDTAQTVGSTRTWLPSSLGDQHRVQVGWVWPLLDRPHRLLNTTVFLDDDLASSVSGGRLDRSLEVVERASRTVPLTLVLDPELIDELSIMSTGRYTVEQAAGQPVAGTGAGAASAWLQRLHDLLAEHPGVTVELTPFADPDLDTLARAAVPIDTRLPRGVFTRMTRALGDVTLHHDLLWPAGGSLGVHGLRAAGDAGATSVLLDRTSVAPREIDNLPVSLARLDDGTHRVSAALTSPAIQNDASSVLSSAGSGIATLPQLLSEIAVRADQQPASGHVVVVTPPRYVDPSVRSAVRAITSTSSSLFSVPVDVAAVLAGEDVPSALSRLQRRATSNAGLPAVTVRRTTAVAGELRPIRALLAASPRAQPIATGLPAALQRVESSAWRRDTPSVTGVVTGVRLSRRLSVEVDSILSGVRIVKPHSGSYTLASDSARMPITVANTLAYAVRVQLTLASVGDRPGFTAQPVTKVIQPNSRRIMHVPAQLQRSGRIAISAQLRTPAAGSAANGIALGDAVTLNVRSTVFGVVGVVITVVAGIVLVLALLVRYVRRIQRIRRKRDRSSPKPRDPVSASSAREPAP